MENPQQISYWKFSKCATNRALKSDDPIQLGLKSSLQDAGANAVKISKSAKLSGYPSSRHPSIHVGSPNAAEKSCV
jgi:hypothetical protein